MTEEKLALAARQAKREKDFLQNELADAAAAHEAILKASPCVYGGIACMQLPWCP